MARSISATGIGTSSSFISIVEAAPVCLQVAPSYQNKRPHFSSSATAAERFKSRGQGRGQVALLSRMANATTTAMCWKGPLMESTTLLATLVLPAAPGPVDPAARFARLALLPDPRTRRGRRYALAAV